MRIFTDYYDFGILPWDPQGVGEDGGRFFPIRKVALRLLMKEKNEQEYKEYKKGSKGQKGKEENNDSQEEQEQEKSPGASQRNTVRKVVERQRHVKGECYKEKIENTAYFDVPDYEEATKGWNDKSWMKYAMPLELDEYFKKHPEEKPEGWVSPVREDTEQEKSLPLPKELQKYKEKLQGQQQPRGL